MKCKNNKIIKTITENVTIKKKTNKLFKNLINNKLFHKITQHNHLWIYILQIYINKYMNKNSN